METTNPPWQPYLRETVDDCQRIAVGRRPSRHPMNTLGAFNEIHDAELYQGQINRALLSAISMLSDVVDTLHLEIDVLHNQMAAMKNEKR